ncbi:MAG: LON peptidase substrate-binding domain-containing protein [Fimbriimonadaceae bacterium]
MAEPLKELPLFLLQTVLFPYAHIQLHVFEDRYVQMVRNCIEKDQPFGVVLIRSGPEVGGHADPYMVGTTVHIKEVIELGNGLMDIQVRGEQRFRIRKFDESRDYLVGLVEPVVETETEDEPRTDALVMRCREDFHAWIAQLVTRQGFNIQIRFPEDITALSYAIANMLPIDNLEKQRLLELTDTMERVSSLIALLEQELINGTTTIGLQRLNPDALKEWISKN